MVFFRPAFLEEYERHEEELNQIYENYVNKFRCYTFLQQQLQQLHSLNQVIKYIFVIWNGYETFSKRIRILGCDKYHRHERNWRYVW